MSDLPATYDLTAYRGDTWAQTFRLLESGVAVDLTTATVACWAGHKGTYTPLAVDVPNPATGEITIAMPDPPLPAGRYTYDLEISEPSGRVTTWVRGKLRVDQDVTHAG